MAIEAIVTDKAPAAVGPYSAATKAGNCIHVSGQLPVDPATGEFAGDDIASQTRQSLTNVKNVLEAAGATMADVAETTVLLDSIADFGAMNEVYAEFFAAPYPARAAFEVAALPKGAKVEIKAVAYLYDLIGIWLVSIGVASYGAQPLSRPNCKCSTARG